MSGWFYLKEGWIDDTEMGPFADDAFRQMAFDGDLKPKTKIRHDSYTGPQWVLLEHVPNIHERYHAGIKERDAVAETRRKSQLRLKQQAKDELAARKRQQESEKNRQRQAEAENGWYICNDGHDAIGPLDDPAIQAHAARGLITAQTQVLHPIHTNRQWVLASVGMPALVMGTPFHGHGAVPHFHCPYCSSGLPPMSRSKISTGGWIMFVLLLVILCWPLCWIGLLMTEEYRVCQSCGMKLG